MPALRMTTRRWMIAVAIVAMSIWGATLWRRARLCQAGIRHHDFAGKYYAEMSESHGTENRATVRDSLTPEEIEGNDRIRKLADEITAYFREKADYHFRARREYERARWRFWESVPSLPPEAPDS